MDVAGEFVALIKGGFDMMALIRVSRLILTIRNTGLTMVNPVLVKLDYKARFQYSASITQYGVTIASFMAWDENTHSLCPVVVQIAPAVATSKGQDSSREPLISMNLRVS